MSSNAVRKLNLLRTEGRAQGHDEGLGQETPGDFDIEKINKGIKFFSDNFFSMFVNMLTGRTIRTIERFKLQSSDRR